MYAFLHPTRGYRMMAYFGPRGLLANVLVLMQSSETLNTKISISQNTVKYVLCFTDKKICSETCNYLENNWDDIKLNENKCTLLKVIFAKAQKVQLLVKLLILKLNHLLIMNENDENV